MCIICIMWARQGNSRLRSSLRGRRKKLRERGVGERREIQSPNLPFSILSCPYPLATLSTPATQDTSEVEVEGKHTGKGGFQFIHTDLTPRICVAVPTL